MPGATLASVPDHPTKITFHTLRHTHASMLIQEGAPIPLVSRRLGHASTRMTLDTYAHMYPSGRPLWPPSWTLPGRPHKPHQAPALAPAPADLEARRTTRATSLSPG